MALEVLDKPGSPQSSPFSRQIEKLLRSDTFRHSEQLRLLLTYLAEQSVAGTGGALKEYTIGVECFARPGNYDPRKDATVRIQVGRLRAKLTEYYQAEGARDAVVVSIPKGSFRLEFQQGAVEQQPPEFRQGQDERRTDPTTRWKIVAISLAVLCLTIAIWDLERGSRQAVPPSLADLWRPFLSNNREAIVTLGSHFFVYLNGVVVRDWKANDWEELERSDRFRKIHSALGSGDVKPMQIYDGLGEAEGAMRIIRLFTTAGRNIEFRRSTQVSWDDIASRNVILLGAPKTVSQMKDFKEIFANLDFSVLGADILNRHPRPGEKPAYTATRDPDTYTVNQVYGLVTMIAGKQGLGSLMWMSSPDTEGILAACQAVTTPELAAAILSKVGRSRSYQVLIHATVRKQTPLNPTVETFRTVEE